MPANSVGDHGEEIAADYLEAQGYRVLERNYRFERAEVDLICLAPGEPGGELVFVEVKARSGLGFGRPEEAVTEKKQQHITHAAKAYLHERRLERARVRFDVVSVLFRRDRAPEIEHFEDAFWASS